MKSLRHIALMAAMMIAAALTLGSCSDFFEGEGDCPLEVYVKFRYDYNLQRANMFADHVSAVTLYVFDDNNTLVATHTERNTPSSAPLRDPNYEMYLKLPYGRYHFMALAGDPVTTLDPTANAASRAKFIVSPFTTQQDMTIHLTQNSQLPTPNSQLSTPNSQLSSLPLDTLWHGMSSKVIEPNDFDVCRDTISLIRDTKQIMVSLCDIDSSNGTDINNFTITITDHNAHLLWDNSVDPTYAVLYHPYATWNAQGITSSSEQEQSGNSEGVTSSSEQEQSALTLPQTAHAQFMTSRIIAHTNPADDATLYIYNKEKDEEVATLNLVDLLCRLRNYDDLHRYTPQEFLDRAYDYNIEFFLKAGKPAYIDVTTYVAIGVNILSWSRRVQLVQLQ